MCVARDRAERVSRVELVFLAFTVTLPQFATFAVEDGAGLAAHHDIVQFEYSLIKTIKSALLSLFLLRDKRPLLPCFLFCT